MEIFKPFTAEWACGPLQGQISFDALPSIAVLVTEIVLQGAEIEKYDLFLGYNILLSENFRKGQKDAETDS